MRLRGSYSETHTVFYEHIEKYLQLKKTNPALALAELKKAVWIQYEGHPKSDEYLNLLFELDTAGEATLPQTLAGNKLVLEMVVDNGFSNEVIRLQRRSVERDEQRIEALKAEGKDPDGQYLGLFLCRRNRRLRCPSQGAAFRQLLLSVNCPKAMRCEVNRISNTYLSTF